MKPSSSNHGIFRVKIKKVSRCWFLSTIEHGPLTKKTPSNENRHTFDNKNIETNSMQLCCCQSIVKFELAYQQGENHEYNRKLGTCLKWCSFRMTGIDVLESKFHLDYFWINNDPYSSQQSTNKERVHFYGNSRKLIKSPTSFVSLDFIRGCPGYFVDNHVKIGDHCGQMFY